MGLFLSVPPNSPATTTAEPTPGTEPAEASAPEAPVSAPAASTGGLASIADALRAAPRPAETPDDADGEETAQPSAEGEAAAPPGGAEPGKKPTRIEKAKAAVADEFQAKVDEAVTEALAQRQRAEASEQQLQAFQAEQRKLEMEVAQEFGSDAEFQRLNAQPSSVLSWEDQQRLEAWKAARARYQPVTRRQDNLWRDSIARHFNEVEKRPDLKGVDRDLVRKALGAGDLAAIVGHYVETATAEAKEQVKQLQTELKALKTRAAARPDFASGGVSGDGAESIPDFRTATPGELFAAGLRQRQRKTAGATR